MVTAGLFTNGFAIEDTGHPLTLNKIVPLTPNIAIRIQPNMLPRSGATLDFRHFSLEEREIRRQEAIAINRVLVRSAEDAVFSCDEQSWIKNFVKKNRNFRVETENIQIGEEDEILQWTPQLVAPYSRISRSEDETSRSFRSASSEMFMC